MHKKATVFTILIICFSINFTTAQSYQNGKWTDEDLLFKIVYENIKKTGELHLCIANKNNDMCIGNLMVPFEVLIYDRKDSIIWSSIWTGNSMKLKFKKRLPMAYKIHIKAKAPYVINKLTTTKIYQNQPLELLYIVQ